MAMEEIEAFKKHLAAKDMSSATATQYVYYVEAFQAFIGIDLKAVTEEDLTNYLLHLRKRKIGKSSIKRYFSGINSYYKFLVRKKYIPTNPVPDFRDEYLRSYKDQIPSQRRQIISIERAKALVQSILDPRERAVVVTLFKTGVRCHELSEIDLADVDIPNLTIRLKPTGKRSNEIVYFDDECAFVLRRWLKQREKDDIHKNPAFFLNRYGERLSPVAVSRIVAKYAIANGLHNPNNGRRHLQDRFTTHCCRHAFTTWLQRTPMKREFVKELRGDARREAIDLYDHIDQEELKEAYLLYMPRLGII
jgi:integrase/recombinase XerD